MLHNRSATVGPSLDLFSVYPGRKVASHADCLTNDDVSLLNVLTSMQLGVDTVPVLVGPVSYLLLSKAAKGVEKSFSLLSLLGSILPIYK